MTPHALTSSLAAFLYCVVAGCASVPAERARPTSPPPIVTEQTWRIVDGDIWTASRSAADEAEGDARASLGNWIEQVRRRTDEVFVPWYTSFGTQQWLAIKAGFYGMGSPGHRDDATRKLAEYLQEQFYEQVLEPVSRHLGPQQIRERAASLYVRRLAAELRVLPDLYFLPADQFHRRLARIPAIHLYTVPSQRTSLDQLMEAADNLGSIPAYAALLKRVRPEGEPVGSELPRDRFFPMASLDADEVNEQLAIRGGATAAGLALGGIGGILVSIGVSAWQATEHERHKPALEAELRADLGPALDGMWRYLAADPYGGVAAPVRHMTAQIENGLLSAQLQAEQEGVFPTPSR